MAWKRNIPFGYIMSRGTIHCCPIESKSVKAIYSLYCNGMTYSEIADEMMRQGIAYHNHTTEWNKHMVKRILENDRYLGEKEYPAIIGPETFLQVQLVRGNKNTYIASPVYIQPIREKAVCGKCGARMLRDTKGAGKVRWHCESETCTNRHYVEDVAVRKELAERLTTLANAPQLLDWTAPQRNADPTLETARIQSEVIREMNKSEPSVEYTKMLIFACAAERYGSLPDNTPYRKLKKLQDKLYFQPVSETICKELFQTAVAQVAFTESGTLTLWLINQNIVEPEKEELPCQ